MKTIITSVLILFLCSEANAQAVLTGPHGGRIKIAKGYRIETLGCDNFMEIYLYNEADEPIFNNGISGNTKFYYEKNTVTEPLMAYGIDGFSCKISSSEFSHYEVTMNLQDKLIISASFNECVVPKQ